MELPAKVAGLRVVGAEFEDVEVKRAAGGLPQAIAETMSAFAPAGSSTRTGNGVGQRILAALSQVETASREELQAATGASRSGVTRALNDLIANGFVESTAPARSPARRYRRK